VGASALSSAIAARSTIRTSGVVCASRVHGEDSQAIEDDPRVLHNVRCDRKATRVVGKRLEAWAKRAGIEQRVYPHRLRHSFGMRVFARTGDVLVTARAMCHRSIASTAVYARPDAGRVRDAVSAG
jgi:site-specific recombinase XerC